MSARTTTLTISALAMALIQYSTLSSAPLDDLELNIESSVSDDDLALPPDGTSKPMSDRGRPESISSELPQGEASTLGAARAAFGQNQIRRCLDLLTIAKAQDPSLPPPRLVLADMYFQAGARGVGQATLERVAVENPKHPQLWRLFGSLALSEQRWTEAIIHFERGLDALPPPSWNRQQQQAFKLSCNKGLAAAFERRGDHQQAARVLGELAEMAPKDSQMRDRYASVLYKAGMKEKAYEQFKIAFLRDNETSPPELSMGVMHVNEGEFQQGDHWFARALEAHPKNAMLHFQIAVALMVQDRALDSAKHSAQAAHLGLDSPDLKMVRGYAARQMRQYQAAERFFRETLSERPGDISAVNQLTLVLIEQKDDAKKQEAFELATELLQAREQSANAQATLGWVMYRTGKVDEAEKILRDAIAKSSIGPEALYLAGRAFSDQGNNAQADVVAEKLAARISMPGIYVLRPVARKWLENRMETASTNAVP